MKILKTFAFGGNQELVTFVIDNAIPREDIITIVSSGGGLSYTIFFYAEPQAEEKTRNIWGKLKD